MTLAFSDLALYAIAVFILFITPGPVWVALFGSGNVGWLSGGLAAGAGRGDWRCGVASFGHARCELGGQ